MNYLVRNTVLRRNRAFSMVEMMVAMALVGGVMAGAFSFTAKMTRSSKTTVDRAEADLQNQKFMHLLDREIANIVNFYDFTGDFGTNVMRGLNCDDEVVPTSVVAMPTHSFANLPENNGSSDPWEAIDSELLPNTELTPMVFGGVEYMVPVPIESDAIRYAYIDPLIPAATLFRPGGPGTAPAPTKGNVPIIIEDTGTATWRAGDFGVIRDSRSSRLFRVTSVDDSTSGQIKLYHSTTDSHYNRANYAYDFGLELADAPYVYQAKLRSMALDRDTNELKCDNHINDDGFDKSSGTFGSPGRLPNWATCAKGIIKFVVEYQDSASDTWRRNPKTNVPSTSAKSCLNQVGYPSLKMMRIRMTVEDVDGNSRGSTDEDGNVLTKIEEKAFGPEALRNHSEGMGDELEGDPQTFAATGGSGSSSCGASGYCGGGF